MFLCGFLLLPQSDSCSLGAQSSRFGARIFLRGARIVVVFWCANRSVPVHESLVRETDGAVRESCVSPGALCDLVGESAVLVREWVSNHSQSRRDATATSNWELHVSPPIVYPVTSGARVSELNCAPVAIAPWASVEFAGEFIHALLPLGDEIFFRENCCAGLLVLTCSRTFRDVCSELANEVRDSRQLAISLVFEAVCFAIADTLRRSADRRCSTCSTPCQSRKKGRAFLHVSTLLGSSDQ